MTAAPDTLTVPEAPELAERALSWPERAEAVQIATDADFESAGELLVGIKSLRGEIADHHGPVIQAAHAAHKAALAAKKRLDEPLDRAERTIKGKLATYHAEQRRRAREEQERLEAEARARDEEERLARAEALEAEGRTEEAEAVLEGESAPPPLPVAPVAPPPKAAGVSMRETWSAEVVDLMALVRAVAEGKAPLAYLQADQKALNGVARSLRGDMVVPGVRAVSRTDVAAGRS